MSRIVRHVALLALSVSGWCVNAAPARVLFPSALHLTRETHDPVSGTTTTIDEYCSGNRVVSISAGRTVIADYGKQEITEIDRQAGTFEPSATRCSAPSSSLRGDPTGDGLGHCQRPPQIRESTSRLSKENIVTAYENHATGARRLFGIIGKKCQRSPSVS